MARTKYVIKNIKLNNYFNKNVTSDVRHFVRDIEDAKMFDSKKIALQQIDKFTHKENYEVVTYKWQTKII